MKHFITSESLSVALIFLTSWALAKTLGFAWLMAMTRSKETASRFIFFLVLWVVEHHVFKVHPKVHKREASGAEHPRGRR